MHVLAALGVFLAGAIVLARARDPFHWAFDAGLVAIVIGVGALVALALARLTRARRRVWRVCGIAGWVLAAALAGVTAILAVNYRWIVFREAPAAAWNADLALLRERLVALPPRLAARAKIQTMPVLDRFIADMDRLGEDARHARLAEVMASLGDGHSLYFPFFPSSSMGFVPLQARFFDDGLFVVAAGGRHRGLDGHRIVRIQGLTVDEALRAMAPYVAADNDASRRQRAPMFMLSPRMWGAIGIGDGRLLALDVERAGATRRVELEAGNRARYLWWVVRPYLADRAPWRMRVTPDGVAVVVELRRIQGETRGALGGLAADILDTARKAGARKVVIDVRENGGGDNTLLPPLVDALGASEFNRPDRLYVLTSAATFSAATNFVSLMEARTRATRVGGPTGSGPNHHGDSSHVILPGTRAPVFLSTRWHQFGAADDLRASHEPQVRVTDLAADFFAGRDAALEAALSHR